jgi:uncharacterized membrane protein YfcA
MDISVSDLLAVACGALCGLVLGVIGGGGSVLAVPLLVYVVGVTSPHVAIGTSAVAVAVSAFASLIDHARRGHVCWPVATLFATAGVSGAAIGSTVGKLTGGQTLLVLFGIAMIALAVRMATRQEAVLEPSLTVDRRNAPRVAGLGFAAGMLAGFFGIGGGVLAVPGLVAAAAMPMILAVGSSLVSVTAFGLTTAGMYALSGLIDWRLVVLFVGGSLAGGAAGGWLATRLAKRKRALSLVFAGVVAAVGVYVIVRGVMNLVG